MMGGVGSIEEANGVSGRRQGSMTSQQSSVCGSAGGVPQAVGVPGAPVLDPMGEPQGLTRRYSR